MRRHCRPDRACVILVLVLFSCANAVARTQQEHVHGMSHAVMPFDMTKTVHVFTMTESGGIERVIVKDKRDREAMCPTVPGTARTRERVELASTESDGQRLV